MNTIYGNCTTIVLSSLEIDGGGVIGNQTPQRSFRDIQSPLGTRRRESPALGFVRSSVCLLRSGTGTGPLHSLDKSAAGDLNVLLILPILLTLILLLPLQQQQQQLLLLLLLLQLPGRPHRDIYDQRRYWQSIRPVAPPVAHKLHRLQILALHGTVFITHHTVDVVMQTVWATGYSNDMS